MTPNSLVQLISKDYPSQRTLYTFTMETTDNKHLLEMRTLFRHVCRVKVTDWLLLSWLICVVQ